MNMQVIEKNDAGLSGNGNFPGLSEALGLLFAPGLGESSFRSRVSCLLRKLVPCDVVTFAKLEVATRRMDVVFDPTSEQLERGLPGFAKYMVQYPCFNFDPSVNGGRPFLRSQFLSDAEFYSSPIYREGFGLSGLSDHAAMLLPSQAEEVRFIGLERRTGTFPAEALERIEGLAPHVANAFLLGHSQGQLERIAADPEVFQLAGLSRRQAEVLLWLTQGKSNSEIAEILNLRTSKVKAYLTTVFDKLGVDKRHAALLEAHRLARARDEKPPARRSRFSVAST